MISKFNLEFQFVMNFEIITIILKSNFTLTTPSLQSDVLLLWVLW